MNRPGVSVTRSLRRKLLLPLLLIGAGFATVIVWGIYAQFQNQVVGRARMRAELLANALNYAAESVSRPGELQRIVTAIGAEEEVSLIVVVGGRPARVLATTRHAWLGKALTDLPAREVAEDLASAIQTRQSHNHLHRETTQFDFTAPLLLSRPELADQSLTDGAVMVHLDLRATQAAIRQLTLEFSTAFLTAVGVLAVFGYGLIHHVVLRPISRIGELVGQPREGGGENWAAAATDDELGALARALHESLTRTDTALHELEQQRNELYASETKYRTLVEHIPQMIFIKNRDCRWVSVNENLARSLGRRPEELVGKEDADFFPKELADKYRADDRRIMQTGRTENLEEKYLQDGGELWVHTVKTPVRNERGEITGVFGIFWDITERRRAEVALRESRQLLRQILDAIPVRVFWKDLNLTYQGCNLPFALDSGLRSPEEMMGKTDLEMRWKTQAELYRADDCRVLESGQPKLGYEEPQTKPDGSGLLWLRTSKVPLRDADGQIRGVLGVYEDITERKRAEAERERLIRELQTALAEVKTLEGLIPICSSCKKIRDDQGFWNRIESYIARHSKATFSHGMCPDCTKIYFPNLEDVLPPNPPRPAPLAAAPPVGGTPPAPAPGGGESILLVVLDGAGRQATQRVLEHGGYKVVAVADGMEATRSLSANPGEFGLVVMDQIMPLMDGLMTLHVLRKLQKTIQVIFLTDAAAPPLPPDILPNVRGCLTKPVTDENLLAAVNRHGERAVEQAVRQPSH